MVLKFTMLLLLLIAGILLEIRPVTTEELIVSSAKRKVPPHPSPPFIKLPGGGGRSPAKPQVDTDDYNDKLFLLFNDCMKNMRDYHITYGGARLNYDVSYDSCAVLAFQDPHGQWHKDPDYYSPYNDKQDCELKTSDSASLTCNDRCWAYDEKNWLDNWWVEEGGSCYMYVYNTKNWFDAQGKCKSVKGGLVEIADSDENAYVQRLATSYDENPVWIGLDDTKTEDDFRWATSGVQANVTFWRAGEPNNYGDEDCVMMSTHDGLWLDAGCATNRLSVCERPKSTY